MPNSKLYNIKTTLTDGTIIDSGTIEVPQGEKGDKGLSALECSFSGNSPMSPVVGGSVTIPKDNFNREPIVGDIAIYTWKNSSTNQSYVVSGKCTLSNPGLDKRFQIESFIETTGQSVTQHLYRHDIFIRNTSPTCSCWFSLYTTDSSAYTYNTFHVPMGEENSVAVTGYYYLSGAQNQKYKILYLNYYASDGYIARYVDTTGNLNAYNYLQSNMTIQDTVTQVF